MITTNNEYFLLTGFKAWFEEHRTELAGLYEEFQRMVLGNEHTNPLEVLEIETLEDFGVEIYGSLAS